MSTSLKHIVFINQHYFPDIAATALVLNDLAEECVKEGYRVSVICSRYLYDYSNEKLKPFETKNGVEIYRVNQTNFGRSSTRGRLKDYASFFINATIQSFKLKPDVLVTLTTPPMIGVLGWLHKAIRNCRFIYWSMDLHPEAEIASKLLQPEQFITKLISKWHEKVLHSADKVIALSSNMKKRLLKYHLKENRISVVSIWSDSEQIKPIPQQDAQFQLPEHLRNKFIVHYSGNLGLAHYYPALLEVIQLAQTIPDLAFVFVGGGPQMPELQKDVVRLKLKNVYFQSYVDTASLSLSLAKAHIQWLSLDTAYEGIAYPSKLIAYMASGRPIIFLGDEGSDSAQLIEQAECGSHFRLDQAQEVLKTILYLKDHAEVRTKEGFNARTFFEKNLTKASLTKQWIAILKQIEIE